MRLRELLISLAWEGSWTGGDVDVSGVALDSRTVRPGDVFFALAGTRTDGRRHVLEAIGRGARAVVVESDLDTDLGPVPVVRAASPARLAGLAAACLAGDPSAGLTLVGVTGTNGKTTTTYLLEAIWRAHGLRPGVLGTISYRFDGRARPAPLTTPDGPTLQALLVEMRAAGTTHVAMEVSSHALVQERVAGCRFDAAVLTNVTRDHLDFHGDLERYAEAKASLFRDHLPSGGKSAPVAILNADDPFGAQLAASLAVRRVCYARRASAEVRAREVETRLAGTQGVLEFGGEPLAFFCPLVGAPHVENVLAAAATAWALGTPLSAIAHGLATLEPPAGRLEQIAGPGFTVVVDYAHTPDALARALAVLRPLAAARLIAVFGCGGDRDRGKRPLMGEAAARASDLVVLTSDNPRTEDAGRILSDIEQGVRAAGMTVLPSGSRAGRGYLIEPDRRAAIRLAIGLARPGDIVLLAGKGHEDYQIVGTEKRHLDDREEVRRVLGVGA
jgi:UDP-N-acetylmuramoyl-L-alanyl-D-glutamate--2,6-diaminopimelate ligase